MRNTVPTFRNMMVTAIFSAMLLAASGCVDVVTDIDFPETHPKIVVHAFIAPTDTAVQIMLSWSNPISSAYAADTILYIADARVHIAESGKDLHALSYHPEKNVYALSTNEFPIEAGKQYTLHVQVDGYDAVKAQCYVPFANTSLRLESIEREPTEWSEVVRVEYSFDDLPGTGENFYAPSVYFDGVEVVLENDTIRTPPQQFVTTSGESYLSNKGREGRTIVQRAEGYNYRSFFEEPQPGAMESKTVYMLLLTTDEHYYRYHHTLENYWPNNPFAEPVLIYSNIEGGLGIFAGYNKYVVVVEPTLNASTLNHSCIPSTSATVFGMGLPSTR